MAPRRFNQSRLIAYGGILAAVAIVIMCLGGLILVSTYVCPMLCMLILALVLKHCGNSVAWAWYFVVSILALLLGPDKEAAAIFTVLGYYPIIKPKLEQRRFSFVWKCLLFNCIVLITYYLLLHLTGMTQLQEEFKAIEGITVWILLIMGNLIFFLLDRLLSTRFSQK